MPAPTDVARPEADRWRRWRRVPVDPGAVAPTEPEVPAETAVARADMPQRLVAGVVRHGALILHLLTLVGAFVVLLVIDRKMWFRADDFEFLTKRGLHGATLSIWYPHNEHWSTLPILAYRALFSIYGIRTAQPYLILLFVASLALAHLLWRAMITAGVQPAVATPLVAVFTVLGAGGTDILWSFQIGYLGSLLFGWAFILLVNHEGEFGLRDVLATICAVAALMTSGVAVTMVVVGALVAFMRRGWLAAAVAGIPPAVVYVVWFALVGHDTYQVSGSWQSALLGLPGFIFTGLGTAASNATGSTVFGPILLAGLALWALRHARLATTAAAPAFMGLAGSVVFLAITAMGRDSATEMGARSARYVYVTIALVLPAAGMALSWLVARRRGRLVVLVGLLALVGLANFGQLLFQRTHLTTLSITTEQEVIAAARIAEVGPVVPGSEPAANVGAPDLHLGVLMTFARNGDLPTGVALAPGSMVNAATAIQLGMTPSPLFPPASPGIVWHSKAMRLQRGFLGCWSAAAMPGTPAMELAFSGPGAVRISSARPGLLTATLHVGGVTGSPREFPLIRGPNGWFDVAASPSAVTLAVPAGATITTC